jgi:hypothetical protein
MHPDEWQNMIMAIQQMKCPSLFQIIECLNPHIFVYGPFSLYVSKIIIYLTRFVTKNFTQITISDIAMSLRVISATASIINVVVLIKIIELVSIKISNIKYQKLLIILVATFSPFFIQFSHFGTTESLLMLFYSLIIYYSLKLLTMKQRINGTMILLSLFSGLAIATKISSISFVLIPLAVIMFKIWFHPTHNKIIRRLFFYGSSFFSLVAIFSLVFSPHNLISYQKFMSAFRYESDVALGHFVVFYTRQFIGTIPVWFQLTKVFPYTLGWPIFILGMLGFFGLSWKNKYYNLLRVAIITYFIPSAFLFTKWSRFMAPILPLILIFAVLFIQEIIIKLNQKFWIPAFAGMTMLLIYPGINYLRVYQKPDIRFQASDWIYKNIPHNAYILSETANVVDIPINNGTVKRLNNYNVIAFNFYDLDASLELQQELREHLKKANYIFVPSRRIFANHPKNQYPLLNNYYDQLFSGKLGFQKIAEFSVGLDDEAAEETWTVFDHPVIRIYKKIKY